MKERFTVELTHAENAKIFGVSVLRKLGTRRLVMRLKSQGEILLSAPYSASKKSLLEFICSNREWILKESENFAENCTLEEYLKETPQIFVAAKELFVILKHSLQKPFFVENLDAGEILFAYDTSEDLDKLFLTYAKKAIGKTFLKVAKSKGFGERNLTVRDQRSRWASRSGTGTLSFNWRLILLEPPLQEYIILHELAHEKFMDHSVSFWIHLNRLCENAKFLDKKLAKQSAEIFKVGIV